MNDRSITELRINHIDCTALPAETQRRIQQIGFYRWLDEQAGRRPLLARKPSRYSLEYKQAQMRRRAA